jgi:hypothetical protein
VVVGRDVVVPEQNSLFAMLKVRFKYALPTRKICSLPTW